AAAELNDPIGERGLAVIDVSDDRKIPDPFHGIGGRGGRAEPRIIAYALARLCRRTVLVAPLLPRPPAHIEGVSRDTPEDHPWGSAPHIPVRRRSRETPSMHAGSSCERPDAHAAVQRRGRA